ncbi:serine/threonine-protein phosphatase 7 long form homolog [Triticum aestivum]|uniref:serine/threonine-protein phosphatase 7 long form homolog n=1 Tax=Triticum aestivum TaxID=4565 RepID=UPI001D030EA4|nr:serine/threonine-protein phosphatase 7 long form homolog [Triticum aestivum]
MDTNGCFSDLLWMPHSQHKISKTWENPNICLNVRCHRVGIPFDPLCTSALENLGFYQIAKMRKINVDKYLISALVERWRPETNSFHLPVGEMTITLQDVSCLWGLPIHGKPLVGKAYAQWSEIVERLLGIPVDEQHMKQKKRRKGDDNAVVRNSQYSLNLGKLRERFHVLPDNPMDREINWHARALVLEILGSIVFTDTSGDGVPAMYLQFMQDLGQPTEYNWGAAALALLYRQLSIGAEKERLEISGPLLLLQLWSWSRLPLGRPKVIFEKPKEGEELDEEEEEQEVHLDYNPVFGAKWCAAHAFDVPHNAGTEYYRNQIDLIREGAVGWQPYDDLLEQMPFEVHQDSNWWFARVPLMQFWIVEFHYPYRVMRQFGLRQPIPPSLPRGEAEVQKLRKIKHSAGKLHNWEEVHANYVQEYNRVGARVWPDDVPFDEASLPDYRDWFQQNGMYTVFFDSQCLGGLDKPIPYPRDSIEWTGYMPSDRHWLELGYAR